MTKTPGNVVRKTETVCAGCRRVAPAAIVEREENLFFQTYCPSCGVIERPYPEENRLFREILRTVKLPRPMAKPRFYQHGEKLPPLRGVLLDLTGRCNLYCPHCFAKANDAAIVEPDLATIEEWFTTLAKKGPLPVVFLQGGEPTLRDDLPAVIALLRRLGYRLKLVTNGLRLIDFNYAEELRKAGLEWVFLQFDGLSSEASRTLRGNDLSQQKQAALANLVRLEFKVLLACMVKKTVNLDQIGPVMDFAIATPQVQQVSFLPASGMGRDAPARDETFTSAHDILQALAEWSHGQLTQDDFIAFLGISRALWRLTGNPDYKPKTCLLPMVLAVDGERIAPLNRALRLPRSRADLRDLRRASQLIRHLANLDDMPYSPHLLTMVIEHFREPSAFDLDDACRCTKYHVTEKGFSPACIYNAFERAPAECENQPNASRPPRAGSSFV